MLPAQRKHCLRRWRKNGANACSGGPQHCGDGRRDVSDPLPFLLFDRGGKPPRIVLYLGRVLPPAIIMMLIIYCLRNVSFTSASHGIPELVCVTVAAALHWWKGNNLLSIFTATALYMFLLQVVF